jgi:glycosyltransferase involved in cell wall biosynthesis
MPLELFRKWLRCERLIVNDRIRFSDTTRKIKIGISRIRTRFTQDPSRKLDSTIETYRLAQNWPIGRKYCEKIQELTNQGISPDCSLSNNRGIIARNVERPINRSIILKNPSSDGERGVLAIFGEDNWLRMVAQVEKIRELHKTFELVLIASWSPAEYSSLLVLAQKLDRIIFVEPGNYSEHAVITALHPRLIATPTICSDWLDPKRFVPRPFEQKDLDFLMIANWAPYKRHWDFFRALAKMDPSLRVTLIGQRDGLHTVERAQRQARDFGVVQKIEFLDNAPTETLHACLSRAKVFVITSRREGPCVAVAESLFSGTPVGLRADAHVGTTAHINEKTGRLLSGRHLARDLTRLLKDASSFQPREWAVQNIGYEQSIAKLNEQIRDVSISQKSPWSRDLVPYHWAPYPAYLTPQDAESFAVTNAQLQLEYPELFGPKTFG